MLKAWFPTGGIKKWFDSKDSDLINALVHWWTHNLMTLWRVMETRKCSLLGGSRSLEVCLWRFYLDSDLPSLTHTPFLSLLSDCHKMSTLLHHNLLPPWCSDTPHTQSNRASWLQTELSRTIRQKCTFPPLKCIAQVFCHSNGNLMTRVMVATKVSLLFSPPISHQYPLLVEPSWKPSGKGAWEM
jgi:hypothetical protein